MTREEVKKHGWPIGTVLRIREDIRRNNHIMLIVGGLVKKEKDYPGLRAGEYQQDAVNLANFLKEERILSLATWDKLED
jgi:hypothetical protein